MLAGWLIARRHKQQRWFQVGELVVIAGAVADRLRRHPAAELREAARGRGAGARQVDLPRSSALLAFLETGAFLGFIAPGETAVIVGGLVAGQGQISLLALIAIVWVCCVARRPHVATSSAAGTGRQWLLTHGERLKITEERLRPGRGLPRAAAAR